MNIHRILLILVFLVSSPLSASNYNEPISIDSRIKTFVYSPNEVFTIVFSHGYYSYIEFAKGENVEIFAMGNTSGWVVAPRGNKLWIQPLEDNSRTNMIVTTTKNRNYVFDLISRPDYAKPSSDNSADNAKERAYAEKEVERNYSAERDISYIVRFYYPKDDDEFDLLDDEEDYSEISVPTWQYMLEEPEKIIEKSDARYSYSHVNGEENEDMIPIELFDDGHLTYFKFKDSTNIPKILIEVEDGTVLPCKRLLFDGYVIIKGVHRKLFMHYEDSRIEVINESV